jgi:hypothetical protein
MLLMVIVRLTRFRVMARAMPGAGKDDAWNGGPDRFRDYMLAKDLADQEEDRLGHAAGGLDEGEWI